MKLTAIIATLFFGIAAFAAQPNPQMSTVLEALKQEKGKPIETLSPKEARKQPTPTDAVKQVMKDQKKKPDREGFADLDDIKIPVDKTKIEARVYRPEGPTPKPVIVYYHGGGFVIADKDVYDASARALAKQTGAIVVSVDYRLAPEHRFPKAHDDAFAAYKWVLGNAKDFKGDPKKVVVAGESAGGNLAINVAIRARDEKVQAPIYELLVYPVAGSDMNTASYQENAAAKPLSKPMMDWFMAQYLNTPAEAKDPRINVLAANLKGLPPTTIITAEIDPLRSEGKALADKLTAAGVKVQYRDYPGVTHEFFGMAPVVDAAKDAQAFAASGLKTAL